MRIWITLIVSFAAVGSLKADDKTAHAQQLLKDQGFYYGEINGQKDSDTTASIRRYQIRNGLQITGDLNDETLKALQSSPATTPAPVPTSTREIAARTPPPPPDTSDLRDSDSIREPNDNEAPAQRFVPAEPGDQQAPPVFQGRITRPAGGNFAGTPYQNSSPEVQRDLIAQVQTTLARRNLFKGEINGVFTSDLEFSLRAYQSRVGLKPTGSLDLQTLAALELLPGAHEPIYTPRRGIMLPPGSEPPVRGEWIRP